MSRLDKNSSLFRLTRLLLLAASVVCIVAGDGAAELASPSDPSLLHVETVRWGFDNNIQPQEFNLLSLEVHNVSSSRWSGPLILSRTLSATEPIGLPLRQEVTLEPDETRWIQFTVLINDSFDSWVLDWGGGEFGRLELQTPPAGPRPTVLIYNPEAVQPAVGPLRRLPEELFPQTLAGASSLRGIILNDVPFWTGARSRTLREWLQGGGRVYLLKSDSGTYPRFPESMNFLNQPADEYPVGTGVVKRLPHTLLELDIATARDLVFNDDVPLARAPVATTRYGYPQYSDATGWQRHEWAARELRKLVIFSRPWGLIYLAVACYLLTLIPGCYRLGLENPQVRWFYLSFLSAVLIFSIVFVGLGQVGGSERSRLRSLGVAREISDGVYDVTQWTMACVRDEGTYHITPPGSGVVINGLTEMEAVAGIFDCAEGQLTIEMAPASTLGLFHRQRVVAPLHRPELVRIEHISGTVQSVQIQPGPDFAAGVLDAWLVHHDIVYPLTISESTWTLNPKRKRLGITGMITQLESNSFRQFAPWKVRTTWDEDSPEAEKIILQRVQPLLFATAFQQIFELDTRLARVPDGRVRLLIQRDSPDAFRTTDADFPDQRGTLMFSFDYPSGTE